MAFEVLLAVAESHGSKMILRIENDFFPWLRARPITAIEADELLEYSRGLMRSSRACAEDIRRFCRTAI